LQKNIVNNSDFFWIYLALANILAKISHFFFKKDFRFLGPGHQSGKHGDKIKREKFISTLLIRLL